MGQPAPNPAALNEEELYYTDMPVGEILRRARIHYGQSLPDIERALRIRASQIDAIEVGDVDRLPGRVYAIGFVRSYAEYLGLNGDKMVHLFKNQYGRKTAAPALDFPVGASESKIPPLWMVAASLAAALCIAGLWWIMQTGDRVKVSEVPEVAEVMSHIGSQAGDVAYGPYIPEGLNEQVEAAMAPEPAPPPPPEGIMLTISENSWVEIKDQSGKALVSQVLKAGDQYTVPHDRPGLTISLGNAGGIELEVNGEVLRPLGEKGQVVRDLPLNIEYLQKTFKTDPPTSEPPLLTAE